MSGENTCNICCREDCFCLSTCDELRSKLAAAEKENAELRKEQSAYKASLRHENLSADRFQERISSLEEYIAKEENPWVKRAEQAEAALQKELFISQRLARLAWRYRAARREAESAPGKEKTP